jgi:hypothetical protein
MARFSLVREGDGAGDSGPMSVMFFPEDGNRTIPTSLQDRPQVGGVIRVGSPYGRTYQAQDWWQTSLIEEILEESDDYVRFRTRNSIYEWRKY